jgi:signal transduction histidine kinase
MTIRAKLVTAMVAIAIVLLLPVIYAAIQLKRVRDIAVDQREQHAAAFLALGRLQAHLAELDRFERSYIAAPSPEMRANMHEALAQSDQQLATLSRAGYKRAAASTKAKLQTLTAAATNVEQLVEGKHAEQATAYFEKVKPLLASYQASLDSVAIAIDERSSMQVIEASRISDAAATATIISTLIALALAVVIGAMTSRSLTRPLGRLRRAMAAVAAGEFHVPENLPYDRQDEIGDLSRSFRSMAQRLAELEKLKAEFIGIATHELKTPLNVIGGYAELIEEGVYGPITDKHKEILGSIRHQTRVLARMVNQLLDISRLEAGGFRLEMEQIDITGMFEAIGRTFDPLARKKNISFEVVVDSLPRLITGDGDRLRDQVIGNLLSNAFKFTREGGHITVRAWAEGDALKIAVQDNGVGIPEDQLPHIFDRWHQVGQEARTKGAGLGLNIAHDIVEAHGGTIHVESRAGKGTTFCITLPLVSQPQRKPAEEEPESPAEPEVGSGRARAVQQT